MNESIPKLLRRLWRHISFRRRGQFVLLLLLMILASFSEILSIGAVLPFLAVITEPDRFFLHSSAQPVIRAVGLTEPRELLLFLTIAFGFAVFIAGAMRLFLLWASTRLSYAAGSDLSLSIYRRTLYQPYSVHVSRNSSEIISGISNKTNSAIQVISMSLNFISAFIILTAILGALVVIDPITALVAFCGFGLVYIFIIQLTRKSLLVNSEIGARESTYLIKSLQEGLGGIRDVLIDGSQATYCQIYSAADHRLRRAQGYNQFISSSPRTGVEALALLIIAVLAYSLAMQIDGIAKAIPVLGALALGAQRLLPALQQAYGSWSAIQGNKVSLMDALDLLDQPLPSYVDQPPERPMEFSRQISLKQITFRYCSQTHEVLQNISIIFKKGSRVGFIGTTGSGKSTLLDIIMGLLQPTNGSVEIDGQPVTLSNQRAWQSHIAHVPQSIFLADSTIEENIAFGVPSSEIDSIRVRQAAQQAQIAGTIENWPKKYQTLVGERGVRLSGGQRQRIGIARALYKQADVLIFDEATSALDNETEHSVMQSIESLNKNLTILIIAHRLSTLKNCDYIVELDSGCIKRIGNYRDIISETV